MKDNPELALEKAQSSLTIKQPEPSVGQMLQAVIEKGVTAENVAAVEAIVKLYERVQDKEAEREFAKAFTNLQAQMPSVQAMRAVPNKDGSVRYKFAPFEDVMEQVSPHLRQNNFCVTFSQDYKEQRMVQTVTLIHSSGHKISGTFAVRVGSGPPGSTECQADGAASAYAKRYALCSLLNIVIEHDQDARAEGVAISPEKASELRERVLRTNSNEQAFLKLAGVLVQNPIPEDYEKIMDSKLELLESMLAKKERR